MAVEQEQEQEPTHPAQITSEETGEGFTPIFDGQSLDGWVGLDGDRSSYYGAEVYFRNLRVKELPWTTKPLNISARGVISCENLRCWPRPLR